ncbi:sulfotransferase family protein [Hasllibacter halocynthiae]|uniref:Sulfotransferase family protein n=1 Tax=Hasllibacter halocynthiae TaxID=595589 RepID=A0A2T0X489_9RHOB|nr:sulfotransferase [Hasllibacter halocynthiae]PRY93737.1 sulfotransferase family protein [Hasllibacter halocynthiae]
MDPRYVFVGGLHRSGTTLMADCLEAHPAVRGLPPSLAPEGEGVFFQGAIPHDALAGVPGEWAEDPAMHMVEGGPWDRPEVAGRLRADWDRWYPKGGSWRVEKSPVNLLRARLYQQLLPASQFVFVVRHPVASARATAKWSARGEAALLRHWAHAHSVWAGDVPRLHNWMVVRLEDLCADPRRELARLFAFLRLDPVPPPRAVRADPNADYLGDGTPVDELARSFGYGPDGIAGPSEWRGRHWFRDVREAVE